jgi:hypothetical protein
LQSETQAAAQAASAVRECQWCDIALEPGVEVCPSCGSKIPDPNQEFPSLTTPPPIEDMNLRAMHYPYGAIGADELAGGVARFGARVLFRMITGS